MKLFCTGLMYVFFLVACSGNAHVISGIYNRAGNSVAKRFYQYADFNKAQRSEIKTAFEQYHQWHRKRQLPQYVAFIEEIRDSVTASGEITIDKIEQWSGHMHHLRDQLNSCNPLNYSANFFVTLSDKQVQQIEVHFDELDQKEYEALRKYPEAKKFERREKVLIKNLGRIGLHLNEQQKGRLTATLAETQPLEKEWRRSWGIWKAEFIRRLESRKQPEFHSEIQILFENYWGISEKNYHDIVMFNRKHWHQFIHHLLNSLTATQEKEFLKVMHNLIRVFDKLSTSGEVIKINQKDYPSKSCQAWN